MSKSVIETPPRGSFNFDICKRNYMLATKGNKQSTVISGNGYHNCRHDL
ncbi:putative proteasome subunit beta type 7,10 [Corchorus olitorius]|uniref:Proteasome subunit beta type 7,10 n=1 Tax=Corchorus olitorius TaxID=93759 RepID=A0A1R3GRF3_9ROSI|nr:putative proteasome subunit beta type 7,10 [Corchorus olitorius]